MTNFYLFSGWKKGQSRDWKPNFSALKMFLLNDYFVIEVLMAFLIGFIIYLV